jgi:hypothetical protein
LIAPKFVFVVDTVEAGLLSSDVHGLLDLMGRLERFLLIETKGVVGNLGDHSEALMDSSQ